MPVLPMQGVPEALRAMSARGCRHYLITHRDSAAWTYLDNCGLKDAFSGGITS